MKSVLKELSYGNINTGEQRFEPNSSYEKEMKTITEIETKLMNALGESQRKLIDEYMQAQLRINDIASTDRFIYGFKLGSMITYEVMSGIDNFIK